MQQSGERGIERACLLRAPLHAGTTTDAFLGIRHALLPFHNGTCRTTLHAQAAMCTEILVHLRRTRHGHTVLTQLYHPTQETEQGKERLLRPLNLLHVHAIQMLRIGGILQLGAYLGTKLFGKLQVVVIGTAGRNGITVAAG